MWLNVPLLLVLLIYKVNTFPHMFEDEQVEEEWDSHENITMAEHEEERSAIMKADVPCLLKLPRSQRVLASDVNMDYFKPDRDTRPLPDVLKAILLPSPQKPVATPPTKPKSVEILCHLDQIYVRVLRSVFINPNAGKSLKVGTCSVNHATPQHYYFVYPINSCDVNRQEDDDRVTYSNSLNYEPIANGEISQEIPFTVQLECNYNKHYRAYRVGFQPQVDGGTLYLSLNFGASLTVVNSTWKSLLQTQNFVIGQPIYFLAKARYNPQGKRLYLNKCYITSSQNPESTPKHLVVDNYGCMVDSSPQSKFYSGVHKAQVKFSVGAGIPKDINTEFATNNDVFIHCEMTLGPEEPTPSMKSCSYNADTKQWSELYGDDSVCTCCNSSCPAPEPLVLSKIITSNPWELEHEEEDLKPNTKSLQSVETDLDYREQHLDWDPEEEKVMSA